jgi:ubiquitin-conjugating enzyme E2 M
MVGIVSVHKESIWGGATYRFKLSFPTNYPMDPPKITAQNKIFHPNLDLKGGVCLPLVREDWLPTYSLTHILLGLLHLFLNPNPRDPLNVEAADLMTADPERFRKKVRRTLEGGIVDGERYEPIR